MNDATMREMLQQARRIAVVGLSDKPDRPSYGVAAYLQRHGYTIIPINPTVTEVLGERAYPDLASVPEPIDIVDIFRRSEQVGSVVEEAINVGAKAVWLQLGIENQAATAAAEAAGLQVVSNRCIKIDHARLIGR